MKSRSFTGKVLVLGADQRSGLAIVRSLGRGSIEVHIASHCQEPITIRSRYVNKAHHIPLYSQANLRWKDALTHLMENQGFDLVLPSNDMWATALQTYRADFERLGRLYVLNDNAFEVLFDKLKTSQLARSLGVPIPDETVVSRLDDLTDAIKTFGLPLVLKPSVSFNPFEPDSRREVRIAYSEKDVGERAHTMLKSGPISAQRFFVGQGVGVELLLYRGDPLIVFQHERVHEPLCGGGSSYRKSVKLSENLVDAALRIFRYLAYTGVTMAEFRVNPNTGEWALMEINARFWGSLPLAVTSGADFPYALYQFLVKGKTKFSQTYRSGVYCRNLTTDLPWYFNNLRANHYDQTLNVQPLFGDLARAATNIAGLKEHIDTFAVDDPAPFFEELSLLLKVSGVRVGTTLAKRYLSFPLTRRRLYYRGRRALYDAHSVLFVCKGNICRSPFAELLARQYWPSAILLKSGGYLPKDNRESPIEAVTAAKNWGVDLAQHRSTILTEDIVRSADVIFVFDYENYVRFCGDFGFAKSRTHFLLSLLPKYPLYVEDPIGQGLDRFQQTYDQIARAIFSAPHTSIKSQLEQRIDQSTSM